MHMANAPTSATTGATTLIRDVEPDGPVVDVMGGAARREVRLHEHGLVALVDAMPRLVPEGQTADTAVVQAARVSYGAGTKKVNEDRGLIRYLMRHRHSTPLEMVEFKFHVVAPIFIARQWLRHRTASVNEYSARYSVVRDRYYHPDRGAIKLQSISNRQGGSADADETTAADFSAHLDEIERHYADYERFTEAGVARETARIALPVSVYTEWYWKLNLHNLFHFLALRLDAHAQQEIRDYAEAVHALIRPVVPIACEAFADYRLNAVQLTGLEADALRTGGELASANKRERAEWDEKKRRLGLG